MVLACCLTPAFGLQHATPDIVVMCLLFLQAAHLCQRLLAAQKLCNDSSSSINK
jgi:hypothetical protein